MSAKIENKEVNKIKKEQVRSSLSPSFDHHHHHQVSPSSSFFSLVLICFISSKTHRSLICSHACSIVVIHINIAYLNSQTFDRVWWIQTDILIICLSIDVHVNFILLFFFFFKQNKKRNRRTITWQLYKQKILEMYLFDQFDHYPFR